MINSATLKNLFHYDPETGIFTRIKECSRARAGDIAGSMSSQGYLHISIDRKIYKCHRLAFLYMTGSIPNNHVDHINHVRSDNRWSNLREACHSENSKNKSLYKTSSSGICGVTWVAKYAYWHASIGVNRKRINLGYFKDLFSAACSRKSAELAYGFHENSGAS